MQGDFELVQNATGTVYRPDQEAEESIRRVRRTAGENLAHLLTNQDSQQRGTYTYGAGGIGGSTTECCLRTSL